MAKKKAKSTKSNAAASKKKSTNAKSKSSSKAPPQPTVYVCPYTNQNVYIGKATLKDLKSKSTYTNSSRKRLWILPSFQTRNELYVQAAKAIASTEQALLPSFGGRSWEVTCKLSEPNGQILFRTWKGQMELAALPHMLERIPEPPTWPGRRTTPDEYEEGEDEEAEKRLQQREISSLSSVAWDLREYGYPVPTVTLKWQSPERKIFNSRKAAWEHAEAMAKREVDINKCILGLGASGKLLKPFVPSAPMALKVGKLRFERDGLWVVGQELEWQESRPEELLEEEAAEEERKKEIVPKSGLALYLMSKRDEYRETHDECSTLKQAEAELRKIWKTLSSSEKKEWNKKARGDEGETTEDEEDEEETMEVEEENIPEPEPEPEPIKFTMTPLAFYVKSRRKDYQKERKEAKWSISLSECDIHLREEWKKLDPTVKYEWTQKHIEYEAALWEEKRAEREAREAEERAVREAEERARMEAEEKKAAAFALKRCPGSQVMDLVEEKVEQCGGLEACSVPATASAIPPIGHGIVENESKSSGDDPSKVLMPVPLAESSIVTVSAVVDEAKESSVPEEDATSTLVEPASEVPQSMEVDEPQVEKIEAVVPSEGIATESDKCDVVAQITSHEDDLAAKLPAIPCNKDVTTLAAPVSADNSSDESPASDDDASHPSTVPSSEPVAKKQKQCAHTHKSTSKKPKVPSQQVASRWCMNQSQIDKCYAACMEHYDTVMRTVKARDLHRELQDGFDVFRERGYGRYDMELPVFDDVKQFGFLTDLKKAPWMPVVKAILGDDAILIHKGCFLSMPGSAPQDYHQDGVHLTTQTQRPCHAINVFVPLVDLNSRNGPTEFCLGSHILGLEHYDRDFVEIPKPKAGTPVIFDYRLGHRGLGNNTTRTCRPIVYCTYARATDGKEFRDSVNFSRKRYHKIGELSAKPLSREERRNKRKQSVENQEEEALKQALEESAKTSDDIKSESSEEHSDSHVDAGDESTNSSKNNTKATTRVSQVESVDEDYKKSQLHQDAISMALSTASAEK